MYEPVKPLEGMVLVVFVVTFAAVVVVGIAGPKRPKAAPAKPALGFVCFKQDVSNIPCVVCRSATVSGGGHVGVSCDWSQGARR